MANEYLDIDARGMIHEAYCIDGITEQDCRTIFLDWAISVPSGTEERALVAALLERHGKDAPSHPMTQVLRDALQGRPDNRRLRFGLGAALERAGRWKPAIAETGFEISTTRASPSQ